MYKDCMVNSLTPAISTGEEGEARDYKTPLSKILAS